MKKRWQASGHQWIGVKLARCFQGDVAYTYGSITRWLPAGESNPTENFALWRMKHDNGDVEDLDEQEVIEAIDAYKCQQQRATLKIGARILYSVSGSFVPGIVLGENQKGGKHGNTSARWWNIRFDSGKKAVVMATAENEGSLWGLEGRGGKMKQSSKKKGEQVNKKEENAKNKIRCGGDGEKGKEGKAASETLPPTFRALILEALQHHGGSATKEEICRFVGAQRKTMDTNVARRLQDYNGDCWKEREQEEGVFDLLDVKRQRKQAKKNGSLVEHNPVLKWGDTHLLEPAEELALKLTPRARRVEAKTSDKMAERVVGKVPSELRANDASASLSSLDGSAILHYCIDKKLKAGYISERISIVAGHSIDEALGTLVPNSKGGTSKYMHSNMLYDLKHGWLKVASDIPKKQQQQVAPAAGRKSGRSRAAPTIFVAGPASCYTSSETNPKEDMKQQNGAEVAAWTKQLEKKPSKAGRCQKCKDQKRGAAHCRGEAGHDAPDWNSHNKAEKPEKPEEEEEKEEERKQEEEKTKEQRRERRGQRREKLAEKQQQEEQAVLLEDAAKLKKAPKPKKQAHAEESPKAFRVLILEALQHHGGSATKEEICRFVGAQRKTVDRNVHSRLCEFNGKAGCWKQRKHKLSAMVKTEVYDLLDSKTTIKDVKAITKKEMTVMVNEMRKREDGQSTATAIRPRALQKAESKTGRRMAKGAENHAGQMEMPKVEAKLGAKRTNEEEKQAKPLQASGKPKCVECGQLFNSKSALGRHKATCKPSETNTKKAACKPSEANTKKAACKPSEANTKKAACKPSETNTKKAACKPSEANTKKAACKPSEANTKKAACKPSEASTKVWCPDCGKQFKSKFALRGHKATCKPSVYQSKASVRAGSASTHRTSNGLEIDTQGNKCSSYNHSAGSTPATATSSSTPDITPTAGLPSAAPDASAAAFDRLGNELKCPICRELLDDPHSLPCNHQFCGGCIRMALSKACSCPICKAGCIPRSLTRNPLLANVVAQVKALQALVPQTAPPPSLPLLPPPPLPLGATSGGSASNRQNYTDYGSGTGASAAAELELEIREAMMVQDRDRLRLLIRQRDTSAKTTSPRDPSSEARSPEESGEGLKLGQTFEGEWCTCVGCSSISLA
jgi:hypothetical protein